MKLLELIENNSFSLPQIGGMTNKKRGLKLLMHHKKGKAFGKVKVRLKNSLNM